MQEPFQAGQSLVPEEKVVRDTEKFAAKQKRAATAIPKAQAKRLRKAQKRKAK